MVFRQWCAVQDTRRSIIATRADLVIERHILRRGLARPDFAFKDIAGLPLREQWRLLKVFLRLWLVPTRYALLHLKAVVRGLLRTRNPHYLLAIIRVARIVLLTLLPEDCGARKALYERMYEGRTEFLQQELNNLSTALGRLSRFMGMLLASLLSLTEEGERPYHYAQERFIYPPPEPLALIPTIQPNAPSA